MLLVGDRTNPFCMCTLADLESLSVSSSNAMGAAASAKGDTNLRWGRPSESLLPLLLESFGNGA